MHLLEPAVASRVYLWRGHQERLRTHHRLCAVVLLNDEVEGWFEVIEFCHAAFGFLGGDFGYFAGWMAVCIELFQLDLRGRIPAFLFS
nr:hypothetical protein FRC0402_01928 [Corynebacterium diphtheriae]